MSFTFQVHRRVGEIRESMGARHHRREQQMVMYVDELLLQLKGFRDDGGGAADGPRRSSKVKFTGLAQTVGQL